MKRHLLGSVGDLRIEPIRQRIRALANGTTVVDSTAAMLVWEPRRMVPVFAFPTDHVDAELVPAEAGAGPDLAGLPPMLGPGQFGIHTTDGEELDLRLPDGRILPGAAFRPADPDVEGRITVDFDAFTRWYQEDRELVGHAHDPFKRIEVLPSSRHVRVELDGQLLADTHRPAALLETHLPTRWYLPRDDVRMELLAPSEHRSTCAYKGHASYFSLVTEPDSGRDIAWTYPDPQHDAAEVKDLVCFWSERTDLTVDGQVMRRPVTPWSPPEVQRQASDDEREFG